MHSRRKTSNNTSSPIDTRELKLLLKKESAWREHTSSTKSRSKRKVSCKQVWCKKGRHWRSLSCASALFTLRQIMITKLWRIRIRRKSKLLIKIRNPRRRQTTINSRLVKSSMPPGGRKIETATTLRIRFTLETNEAGPQKSRQMLSLAAVQFRDV